MYISCTSNRRVKQPPEQTKEEGYWCSSTHQQGCWNLDLYVMDKRTGKLFSINWNTVSITLMSFTLFIWEKEEGNIFHFEILGRDVRTLLRGFFRKAKQSLRRVFSPSFTLLPILTPVKTSWNFDCPRNSIKTQWICLTNNCRERKIRTLAHSGNYVCNNFCVCNVIE